MSGRFVTVDGGEGAGKSTQMESIREYLERRGYRVVMSAGRPRATVRLPR